MTPGTRTLLALALAGGRAGGGGRRRLRRTPRARRGAPTRRGEDAVAAASQLGVNFTTLDYRTFDRDSGRVLAGATGKFKKEFSGQSAELKKLVTTNKAVSKGKVLSAGLVSTTRTAPGCCSSWTPT